jgi:hypothetical protein
MMEVTDQQRGSSIRMLRGGQRVRSVKLANSATANRSTADVYEGAGKRCALSAATTTFAFTAHLTKTIESAVPTSSRPIEI